MRFRLQQVGSRKEIPEKKKENIFLRKYDVDIGNHQENDDRGYEGVDEVEEEEEDIPSEERPRHVGQNVQRWSSSRKSQSSLLS